MKTSKNKAFILLSTLLLTIFLSWNFLIGYKIIFRKGERLSSHFSTIQINSELHNLRILIYDELHKIDQTLSSGSYENAAEYIGIDEKYTRIWFGNNDNNYSKNRYFLYRLRFNGKICYKFSDSGKVNFKEIILINLYSNPYTINTVTIEMKKTLSNPEDNTLISFLAKIDLLYEKGNKNPLNPNLEALKEFVVNIENNW